MDSSPTLKLIQQNFIFTDSKISEENFNKDYNENFKLASFTIDYGIRMYSERIDELYKIVARFLENLKKKSGAEVQSLQKTKFLFKHQRYFVLKFWKFNSRNIKNEISLKDSNSNYHDASKKSIDFEKFFTKKIALLKIERSKKINLNVRFKFEIQIIITREGILFKNHEIEKIFQTFGLLNMFYSELWNLKICTMNKTVALTKKEKFFWKKHMIFDEFSEKNAYISSILSNNADTKFFNFLKDITVKSKKTEKKVLKKIKILYKIEEFLRNLSFSNKNKIFWIFRRKKNRSQEKQPKYLRGIFLWVLKRKIKHSEKIPKLLNQASFKENNNEWVLDSEKNGNFQNNFSQRQKKDKLSSCFSSDLNFSRKIIYHNLNELILKRQEKEIYFFKKLNKIQRLNWPCFFKIFEYPYIFFRRKKKQILTQSTEKFLARFLVCLLYISFESNFLPFNCLLNNNIKILIH